MPGRICNAIRGNLTRWVLLRVGMPSIALSYFGTLAVAAWFCRERYDWRLKAISELLYPAYDPEFHHLASLGVAITGLLILPIVGYIRVTLDGDSDPLWDTGAFALGLGAVGLTMAGLVISHPAHGISTFPRMHEIVARAAAIALGAGMLILWACAARAYFASPIGSRRWRALMISWSVITIPALSIALVRAAVGIHLDWSNPVYIRLQDRALWHLGFWEWLGSAAVFLFLLSTTLFMPDYPSQ